MEIRRELIYHYPWLPSLENVFSEMASLKPTDFIKSTFVKYPDFEIQRIIGDLFKAAFENRENILYYKTDECNVYTYLILKILLYLLNNNQITNRIANLYSKITYNQLINENDANIYAICKDLNLEIKYYQLPITYGTNIIKDQTEILKTNFRIHFIDFLKLTSNLKDEYRKLINNPLSEGYVFIQKRTLVRLIQEYVRKKLDKSQDHNPKQLEADKIDYLSILELKELFENISHEWELKKEQFEYSTDVIYREGVDISQNFPPCIKEILIKAHQGQNLIHIERLFLVFILNALNYPNDKVIKIFSNLPDFDRNKTEYQINFAKKKGYTPHSCSTLKSLNLCMAIKYKDEVCLKGYHSVKHNEQRPILHPLFYIQLMQYRKSKEKKVTIKKEK